MICTNTRPPRSLARAAALIAAIGLASVALPTAASACPLGYVPAYWTEDIALFNTCTNRVVGVVKGIEPGPDRVTMSPDGSRAYVLNKPDPGGDSWDREDPPANTIYVIDTATNRVADAIVVEGDADDFPANLALTPDGERAYLTGFGPEVQVLDIDPGSPTYRTVVDKVSVRGYYPTWVKVTPGGTRAYVVSLFGRSEDGGADYAHGLLEAIDTEPGSATYDQVVSGVEVDPDPMDLALSHDGKRAYIAHWRHAEDLPQNNVSVIDLETNSVLATVELRQHYPLGLYPYTPALAVSPDDKTLYVVISSWADPDSGWPLRAVGAVAVLDAASIATGADPVTGTVRSVGRYPLYIALTPDGRKAYVTPQVRHFTDRLSNNLIVIDTRTRRVVDSVAPVGTAPGQAAIGP